MPLSSKRNLSYWILRVQKIYASGFTEYSIQEENDWSLSNRTKFVWIFSEHTKTTTA